MYVDIMPQAGAWPPMTFAELAFYADFAPAQAAAIRRAIELMKESRP
jgi:hypothetical protein